MLSCTTNLPFCSQSEKQQQQNGDDKKLTNGTAKKCEEAENELAALQQFLELLLAESINGNFGGKYIFWFFIGHALLQDATENSRPKFEKFNAVFPSLTRKGMGNTCFGHFKVRVHLHIVRIRTLLRTMREDQRKRTYYQLYLQTCKNTLLQVKQNLFKIVLSHQISVGILFGAGVQTNSSGQIGDCRVSHWNACAIQSPEEGSVPATVCVRFSATECSGRNIAKKCFADDNITFRTRKLIWWNHIFRICVKGWCWSQCGDSPHLSTWSTLGSAWSDLWWPTFTILRFSQTAKPITTGTSTSNSMIPNINAIFKSFSQVHSMPFRSDHRWTSRTCTSKGPFFLNIWIFLSSESSRWMSMALSTSGVEHNQCIQITSGQNGKV